jgi:hypothetical protein
MNQTSLFSISTLVFCTLLGVLFVFPGIGLQPARSQDTAMTILTRGPVHEAFAEPVNQDAEKGLVVPKAPPAPIEELPPDEKPEGDNVVWIPGYWSWDLDKNDYLWISGVWRIPPPEMSWMPGYWTEVEGGFQWVPGFWASQEQEQMEYLPPPPESVEEGPASPAPAPDYVWSPGIWVWYGGHYVWRPGYWLAAPADWIWIPPHYEWTPCGYVFVNGYWDYVIERRGVLFAPVYFSSPVYLEPVYTFCPSVVINCNILISHLFCHPHYGHYYFGDYYDPFYADHCGLIPFFDFHHHHHGFDPIFACMSIHHRRHDPDWEGHLRHDFLARRVQPELRPAPTLEALQAAVVKSPEISKDLVLASPLKDIAKTGLASMKFEKIDENRRQDIHKIGNEMRKVTDQRAKVEVESGKGLIGSGKEGAPQTLVLPKSPLASLSKDLKIQAPPKPASPLPNLGNLPGPPPETGTGKVTPEVGGIQPVLPKDSASRALLDSNPETLGPPPEVKKPGMVEEIPIGALPGKGKGPGEIPSLEKGPRRIKPIPEGFGKKGTGQPGLNSGNLTTPPGSTPGDLPKYRGEKDRLNLRPYKPYQGNRLNAPSTNQEGPANLGNLQNNPFRRGTTQIQPGVSQNLTPYEGPPQPTMKFPRRDQIPPKTQFGPQQFNRQFTPPPGGAQGGFTPPIQPLPSTGQPLSGKQPGAMIQRNIPQGGGLNVQPRTFSSPVQSIPKMNAIQPNLSSPPPQIAPLTAPDQSAPLAPPGQVK